MDHAQERRQQEAWRRYQRTVAKIGLYGVLPAVVLMVLLAFFGGDRGQEWAFMIILALGGLFVVGKLFEPSRPAVLRQRLAGAAVEELHGPEVADPLVPLGHVRLPPQAEPLHVLIEGATGTGKTQTLKGMVAFLRERGDTVVAVDGGYDLHETFGRPDDLVLSIFDQRSPGWVPWNEVRAPSDWAALAQSLIGNGRGEAAQWHSMAKAVFAAVGRSYSRMVEEAGEPFDAGEFFHLLTGASGDELAPLLRGTSAASLAANDKGLGSVRMTFYETLKFWEFLRPGDFSIREWVETPGTRPSIFMPYRRRELSEARNVISCWIDQMVSAAIDAGPSDRRTWILIDELGGLGEIPALLEGVTQLRKTGFRVVAGIQNYEQIEEVYGRNGAATIVNNLSTKIIFRATDGAAAERQSRMIGDARHRITTTNASVTRGRDNKSATTSISTHDTVERVVLPSEIAALPDLRAYVKVAGADTVKLTDVPVYQG